MKKIVISFEYLGKKHIIKYLIYKKHIKNIFEAHNTLIGENNKYYYPIRNLSKYDVLNLIKENNDVAILAHLSTLYLNNYDLEKEIRCLIDYVLDGIEIKNRSVRF